MQIHRLKKYHKKISIQRISNVIVHSVFFFLRQVIFLILVIDIRQTNVIFEYPYTIEDFVFSILFSIFIFAQISNSIISNNIYGFDLSIILLVKEFLFSLIYEFTNEDLDIKLRKLYKLIITLLYLVEALYSTLIRYYKRNEINLYLFKRIGSDPKINGKCNFIII